MVRKRLIALAAAVIVSTLAATGYAVAATGAPTVSAPSARVTASTSAKGGTVRFTAYTNDDLPGATAILTGAIGDFGEAVSVLPDGTIDPEHTSELNLALTQGSFRISFGPLHQRLVNAFTHFKPNLRTCSGHVAVTGAAPVVAGSGTGSYKGISGDFMLTVTVNEVDSRSSCHDGPSVLLAQALFVAGSGTVSFKADAAGGGGR
jgi:hypothetical protein